MKDEGVSQSLKSQSIEETILKLYDLNSKIDQNGNSNFSLLKDYVTIYVQNHNLSDDFFSIMCQHNMIAKLFSGVSKSVQILQIFNLILANTSNQFQLVYIFSHPLFHEYLLNNFNASKETSQSIQYYIQLIKTIVMKLQLQSNSSLLKLFCNNKYPQFPLLLNCLVLAIKKNVKQDLVRVTALHCILQLIQLIIKKQLGYGYLTQIHIFIFFYQLIKQVIQQQLIGQENMLKYVIDLLKAIKYNQQSLLIFFSLLTNLLLFWNISNKGSALNVLFKLSINFSQSEELVQFGNKYLSPIYQIIAKYMFNRYLTNVEVASFITLRQIINEEQNQFNLIKLVKDRFSKKQIAQYVFAIDQKINVHLQKIVREQVFKYNQQNQNFINLKENYIKNKKQTSNSWIYSAFMKKFSADYSNIQYLKKVTSIAGIKFQMGQPINISQSLNQIGALYFYQFYQSKTKKKYFFGQKSQDTLKTEINYNQFRGCFQVNLQFLKPTANILSLAFKDVENSFKELNINQAINLLCQKYIENLSKVGQVYFTLHLKKYFQCSLCQYFYEEKMIKQKRLIQKLYFILNKLCLIFDSNCKNKMLEKLILLRQELKGYIKQNGYKCFLKYIQNKQQFQMIQQNQEIRKNQSLRLSSASSIDLKKKQKKRWIFKEKEQKKKQNYSNVNTNNEYQLISLKIIQFQFLRAILQTKQQKQKQINQLIFQNNLGGIIYKNYIYKYHSYLLKISSMQPTQELLFVKNINFHQNQDCKFIVLADSSQCRITGSLKLYDKVLIQAQIDQFSLKLNQNQMQVNLGSQYSSIVFKSKQQAQDFVLSIAKIKFELQQMLSNSIQQYLNDSTQNKEKF